MSLEKSGPRASAELYHIRRNLIDVALRLTQGQPLPALRGRLHRCSPESSQAKPTPRGGQNPTRGDQFRSRRLDQARGALLLQLTGERTQRRRFPESLRLREATVRPQTMDPAAGRSIFGRARRSRRLPQEAPGRTARAVTPEWASDNERFLLPSSRERDPAPWSRAPSSGRQTSGRSQEMAHPHLPPAGMHTNRAESFAGTTARVREQGTVVGAGRLRSGDRLLTNGRQV